MSVRLDLTFHSTTRHFVFCSHALSSPTPTQLACSSARWSVHNPHFHHIFCTMARTFFLLYFFLASTTNWLFTKWLVSISSRHFILGPIPHLYSATCLAVRFCPPSRVVGVHVVFYIFYSPLPLPFMAGKPLGFELGQGQFCFQAIWNPANASTAFDFLASLGNHHHLL